MSANLKINNVINAPESVDNEINSSGKGDVEEELERLVNRFETINFRYNLLISTIKWFYLALLVFLAWLALNSNKEGFEIWFPVKVLLYALSLILFFSVPLIDVLYPKLFGEFNKLAKILESKIVKMKLNEKFKDEKIKDEVEDFYIEINNLTKAKYLSLTNTYPETIVLTSALFLVIFIDLFKDIILNFLK